MSVHHVVINSYRSMQVSERMGGNRNAYNMLLRKRGGRTPIGRPRRKWEDNIKTDLREI
jgi:hypothetical protein